jgi:glutathione synthase/RimK-type ligase-like ATP-grasp enzyme
VFKAENKEELTKIVAELEKTAQAIVIREFIPNDGDVRVFCVGYKVIGAMKRSPKTGEFRSNISLGGTGARFDLEKYQIKSCRACGEVTKRDCRVV